MQFIPCLSIHGNPVYAVYSFYTILSLDLTSCQRLYNTSVPYAVGGYQYTFDGSAFSLKWSKSICGSCHGGGKLCRLKINKSNSMEPQTECVKGKGILRLFCLLDLKYLYILLGNDNNKK